MKKERIVSLINNLVMRRAGGKIVILFLIIIIGSTLGQNYYKAEGYQNLLIEDAMALLDTTGYVSSEVYPDYTEDMKKSSYDFTENMEPLPGSVLYSKIPATKNESGVDVCIYVTDYGSDYYLKWMNIERATWGLEPVSYSQDLQEGAMLRAGEALESNILGAGLGPHDTVKYPAPTYESEKAGGSGGYYPNMSFGYWMKEKGINDLNNWYSPQRDGYIADYNGHTIGHYTSMVVPNIRYAAQGGAYALGCNGELLTLESGYSTGTYATVFYDEYYTNSTDLYPDLNEAASNNLGYSAPTYGNYDSSVIHSIDYSQVDSVTNQVVDSSTDIGGADTSIITSEVEGVNTQEIEAQREKEEKKAAEEKELEEQQKKEFQAKQKENDARREKEALLNDKTHKHRDDESLTTAGKSHFMAMMIWTLVISAVYFIGSKVLYLRNK